MVAAKGWGGVVVPGREGQSFPAYTPGGMNSNTFRTLEFEAIRALVLSHAGSAAGQARVEALTPHTEPGAVRAASSDVNRQIFGLRGLVQRSR